MTKTLSMVSRKNYKLSANEDFVIFLTSKLIACFNSGFTLKMKSKSIAYLLNGSEQIYWIWDLQDEVHSIWDLWIIGLQECKDNGFFEVGRAGNSFRSGPKIQIFRTDGCPSPDLTPRKVRGGVFNIPPLVVIQLAIAYNDDCHSKHVPRINLKYISYKKSKRRFSFSSIHHINSPKCVDY